MANEIQQLKLDKIIDNWTGVLRENLTKLSNNQELLALDANEVVDKLFDFLNQLDMAYDKDGIATDDLLLLSSFAYIAATISHIEDCRFKAAQKGKDENG